VSPNSSTARGDAAADLHGPRARDRTFGTGGLLDEGSSRTSDAPIRGTRSLLSESSQVGAASAHVTALAAVRTQRQGCGMLWFFAVAAAIGAALWAAVRIEQGLGPAPVGDSGPGSAGEARRCRARRRPPAGRCQQGCRGLPGGRGPRMPHCDARSAAAQRGGEAGVRGHQRLSRCQPRPAGCPRTAARQGVPTQRSVLSANPSAVGGAAVRRPT
jgi:hypothetical protein